VVVGLHAEGAQRRAGGGGGVPGYLQIAGQGVHLTDREVQVVRLVAEGYTNREISQALGLSEHTIKNYMFRVFDKVGVSSRVELAIYGQSLLQTVAPPANDTGEMAS